MKSVIVVCALALFAAAVPALASRGREAGTLQVHAALDSKWQAVACPAGTSSPPALCYAIQGQGLVRGLGQTTESYTYVVDNSTAPTTSVHFAAAITVAGKGEIDASAVAHAPVCSCDPSNATLDFTVTGGTGQYAGAQGSGTVVAALRVGQGSGTDTWSGTLTAPNDTFDLTPPVFSGASAKIVRAPKGKTRVRIHYAVSATDAVDGPVTATCKPASGSNFRIGHTLVTCSATDSSGNTGTARFTVTVRR